MVTEASDEAYSVNLIGGFRCIVGYLVPVLSTVLRITITPLTVSQGLRPIIGLSRQNTGGAAFTYSNLHM